MSKRITNDSLEDKENNSKTARKVEKPNSSVKVKANGSKSSSVKADKDSEAIIIKKDENQDVLSAVYKNCQMGMESIRAIKPQVEDTSLKNLFKKQYKGYETLSKEIELRATKDGDELHDPSLISKAKIWGGIMFNTFTDKSTSKFAEVMIQGINMGIIDLTKLQNNLVNDDNKEYLIKTLNQFQSNLEVLKAYL